MIKSILNILVLVTLFSCGPPRIVGFHNSRLDFGSYQTYEIVHPRIEEEALTQKVRETRNTIEDRIAFEMNSRGYSRGKQPDLDVEYRILLSPKSETQVDRPLPYGYSFYRYYYDPFYQNVSTYSYIEGMVLVELHDNTQEKIAWQASVEFKFNPRREELNQKVLEALSRLFSNYAFEAGSNRPVKEID